MPSSESPSIDHQLAALHSAVPHCAINQEWRANASRWTPQRIPHSRNGSPRRNARAGRGAPPDDEGERKGATTLFLYGALLVACAAVAGQTQFDEALERVAADAVLKLAHGGGVALVCAFSLHRSETRPGRRRGVQSNAAKYLLCALGANFAWRAYRLRGAAPLDEEGEVPEAAQALAAVILLLGLVGLLASCFEGAGQQRDRRRRAIAEYSRRAKVE